MSLYLETLLDPERRAACEANDRALAEIHLPERVEVSPKQEEQAMEASDA